MFDHIVTKTMNLLLPVDEGNDCECWKNDLHDRCASLVAFKESTEISITSDAHELYVKRSGVKEVLMKMRTPSPTLL